MDEALLPPSVLAKARLCGNEYAWRFEDVEAAIYSAQSSGLAIIGGQTQFRFPDGTCELYWLNADASEQDRQSWPAFVERSAREVLEKFREKVASADFLSEALQWPFLRDKIDSGLNIFDYLCFVLYFQAESSRTRHQGVAVFTNG